MPGVRDVPEIGPRIGWSRTVGQVIQVTRKALLAAFSAVRESVAAGERIESQPLRKQVRGIARRGSLGALAPKPSGGLRRRSWPRPHLSLDPQPGNVIPSVRNLDSRVSGQRWRVRGVRVA